MKLRVIFLSLIVIIFLIGVILLLLQNPQPFKTTKNNASPISPKVTLSRNEILISKFPELQVNENIIKLRGEKSEDFVIYINPPGKGLDPEYIGTEDEIDINSVKYNKLTNLYSDSNKVDIFLSHMIFKEVFP